MMDEDDFTIRKMKDFYLIYNKMSETCFHHCVNNLNNRDLSVEEVSCVERCALKSINTNHKIMQVYMEVQPEIISKRVAEAGKLSAQQQ